MALAELETSPFKVEKCLNAYCRARCASRQQGSKKRIYKRSVARIETVRLLFNVKSAVIYGFQPLIGRSLFGLFRLYVQINIPLQLTPIEGLNILFSEKMCGPERMTCTYWLMKSEKEETNFFKRLRHKQ